MSKQSAPLRVVFMGTPEFAATILKHLLESSLVKVVAVYAQPDRPAGRGKLFKQPEVKQLALSKGLPVEQPLHFKESQATAHLAEYAPDILVVAAYGLILPQAVLDIPKLLPINVHASLLPRLRGAAPIQRAIMEKHVVTGITIMQMTAGLDSGPMLLQRSLAIGIDDTSASLHAELAEMGGKLLLESIGKLVEGSLEAIEQDHARATHAPKLRKEESLIDLQQDCVSVHAQIRGLTPWPGANLILCRKGHEDMKISIAPGKLPVKLFDTAECKPKVGSILGLEGENLLVALNDGPYALSSLCPSGKKPMTGRAFYNGYLAKAENPFFALNG